MNTRGSSRREGPGPWQVGGMGRIERKHLAEKGVFPAVGILAPLSRRAANARLYSRVKGASGYFQGVTNLSPLDSCLALHPHESGPMRKNQAANWATFPRFGAGIGPHRNGTGSLLPRSDPVWKPARRPRDARSGSEAEWVGAPGVSDSVMPGSQCRISVDRVPAGQYSSGIRIVVALKSSMAICSVNTSGKTGGLKC
jgi:hypothetical protein